MKKEGSHSFSLINPNSTEEPNCDGKTIEAIHNKVYDSTQECDDRLQAIIYYLDQVPIERPELEGETGSFQFEIRDGEDKVIFIGVEIYETQSEARAAARQALNLARYRVYYNIIDDFNNDLPFGFELLNSRDEVFATHPHQYATDCERDLAVDSIIYCTNNETPQPRITSSETGLAYELVDNDGKVLMLSTKKDFEDQNAVELAWRDFLDRAVSNQNYELLSVDQGFNIPIIRHRKLSHCNP